ncbi:MAG: hypothetical protein HY064_06685 [Bacteroidetes bacterium]|nr:hypothetical protein [Bacteroidota bacterium]
MKTITSPDSANAPFEMLWKLYCIDTVPTFTREQAVVIHDTCFHRVDKLRNITVDSFFRTVPFAFNDYRSQLDRIDTSTKSGTTLLYYYSSHFSDEGPSGLFHYFNDDIRIACHYADEYYSYDPEGKLISLQYGTDEVTDIVYDKNSRIKECFVNGEKFRFVYDDKGRITEVRQLESPEWMDRGPDYWVIYRISGYKN